MKIVSSDELRSITGGATSLTSAVLNAISKGIDTIFSIGQAVGGALRRMISNKLCEL